MWADLLDISVAVIAGGAGALLAYGMLLVIEQLLADRAGHVERAEERSEVRTGKDLEAREA